MENDCFEESKSLKVRNLKAQILVFWKTEQKLGKTIYELQTVDPN